MRKLTFVLLIVAVMMLMGCQGTPTQPPEPPAQAPLPTATNTVEATAPPPTEPAVDEGPIESQKGSFALELPPEWACVNGDPEAFEQTAQALIERFDDPGAKELTFDYLDEPQRYLYCVRDPDYTLFEAHESTDLYMYATMQSGFTPEDMDGESTQKQLTEQGATCEIVHAYTLDDFTLDGRPAEAVWCQFTEKEPPYFEYTLRLLDGDRLLNFIFNTMDAEIQPDLTALATALQLPDAPYAAAATAEAEAAPEADVSPNLDSDEWTLQTSTRGQLSFSLSDAWACVDYDPDDHTPSLSALADRLDNEFAELLLAPLEAGKDGMNLFICYLDPNIESLLNFSGTSLTVFPSAQTGFTEQSMNSSLNNLAGCTDIVTYVEDGYTVAGRPAVSGICPGAAPELTELRVELLDGPRFVHFQFVSQHTAVLRPEFEAIVDTLAIQE